MVKLVNTQRSGRWTERFGGSNPLIGTFDFSSILQYLIFRMHTKIVDKQTIYTRMAQAVSIPSEWKTFSPFVKYLADYAGDEVTAEKLKEIIYYGIEYYKCNSVPPRRIAQIMTGCSDSGRQVYSQFKSLLGTETEVLAADLNVCQV